MKKNAILFCVGLLMTAWSQRSFAQSGLKILNDTKCDVEITMQALVTSSFCGDIVSTHFTVPMGGGSRSWDTPTLFDSDMLHVWGALVPGGTSMLTASDFQFVSAEFSFTGCSAGVGCTPGGPFTIGSTPSGCSSMFDTWTGGCGTYTISARWSPNLIPIPTFGSKNIYLWFQ